MSERGVTCFEVAGEAAGRRLDALLAERLAIPRSEARRLLTKGAVRVNGRKVSARDKGIRVAGGARVEVAPFRTSLERRPVPEPASELTILAAGPGWIVVDKPSGMPVHPLEEEETGTVLNALASLHPEMVGVGEGGLRSGVVHRLDVETSGALVFGTEAEAWRLLRAAFAEHRMEKTYRALVLGELQGEGREQLSLATAQHRPARVRVVEPGDRRASWAGDLEWRALESGGGSTLVEIRPRTGFLHQIRVTFAHLGHPVVGDRTYGAGDAGQASRLMLHAVRLRHPPLGLDVESAEPEEFRRFRESR